MTQAALSDSQPEDGLEVDVLVVGAGLSGLSCAWALSRAGCRVQVLEAAPQPGGVIASFVRDGCLVERGPNTALDAPGRMEALIDALGLQSQRLWASAAAQKRYIVRGGQPVAVPDSLGSFVRTPLFSAAAKRRLLGAPFRRAAAVGQEETVADFVRRRLGPEVLDYAVDPIVGGIFAADPERTALRAAFPKLHAIEQRWAAWPRRPPADVPAAGVPAQRPARRRGPARSFSFVGGLQQLTDTLAAAIGRVSFDVPVTGIEPRTGGGWWVQARGGGQTERWRAQHLVLAVPAATASMLLRPWAADAAQALAAIDYAPMATVATAYRRTDVAHPLDGFGCLVPRREGRQVLGVLFSNRMFPDRAPADTVLLTAFVGGMRQPELTQLPEPELIARVHAEQTALLGLSGRPLWSSVTHWPHALPQYTLGHLDRIARVAAAEAALPGLRLCGNWRGGVSIADCVHNGLSLGASLTGAGKG